jgi:rod shape-determining protein MreC
VTWVDIATGQLTKHANVEGFAKLTSLGVVSVIISTSAIDPHDSLIPPKPKATPTPTVTVTVTPSPSKS